MVNSYHGKLTMVNSYHGKLTIVKSDHGKLTMVIFFYRSYHVQSFHYKYINFITIYFYLYSIFYYNLDTKTA